MRHFWGTSSGAHRMLACHCSDFLQPKTLNPSTVSLVFLKKEVPEKATLIHNDKSKKQ